MGFRTGSKQRNICEDKFGTRASMQQCFWTFFGGGEEGPAELFIAGIPKKVMGSQFFKNERKVDNWTKRQIGKLELSV